jgi:hypothetical protein
MSGQIAVNFLHGRNGFGVDAARRPGAGAEGLDVAGAVEPGERLGHLAATGVLDTDEKNATGRFNGWQQFGHG